MNSKNESWSSPSVSLESSSNLGSNEQFSKVELPSIQLSSLMPLYFHLKLS
jgi:hypothetical protein